MEWWVVEEEMGGGEGGSGEKIGGGECLEGDGWMGSRGGDRRSR